VIVFLGEILQPEFLKNVALVTSAKASFWGKK
jgi:hypothetical protein